MLALITVKVINYKLRKTIHNINFTILYYGINFLIKYGI